MDSLNKVVLGHYRESNEVWVLNRHSPYATTNPQIIFDLHLCHYMPIIFPDKVQPPNEKQGNNV